MDEIEDAFEVDYDYEINDIEPWEAFPEPTWKERLYYKFRLWWLTPDWWEYLFEKKSPDYSWWRVLRCRIDGHKNYGVVWFSHGLEPDMTCRGCGDDIG